MTIDSDDLFVTVANKGTETDSECHQVIGTIREIVSLLKDDLRNKQVTIDNLIDVIKNFWANENKYTRNKEQETDVCSKGDNDVAGELLGIDELHHRFQKLTDRPQSSTVIPTTSINVDKDRIEQNRDELELTNSVKDKNINDQINESRKISITTNHDCSDNDNNTTSDIYNNIVIFGDSIPKGINIRNLNTRLTTATCKCRFFGVATSKHFHHYSANAKRNKCQNRYCCFADGDN